MLLYVGVVVMPADSSVCLGCAQIVYLSALSKYYVAVVLLVMQLWDFNKATIRLICVSWCVSSSCFNPVIYSPYLTLHPPPSQSPVYILAYTHSYFRHMR